jgi:hypothetical protein
MVLTFRRGEPHVGERPERSLGRSVSAAGLRSDGVATEARRPPESVRVSRKRRTTGQESGLGRSGAGQRSVAVKVTPLTHRVERG